MIDYTQPIYIRDDGTYRVIKNGIPYHVTKDDIDYKAVASFVMEDPIRAQKEPSSPGLTKADQIALLESQISEIERKSLRSMRAYALSKPDKDDKARLADYEAQIEALRAQIDSISGGI